MYGIYALYWWDQDLIYVGLTQNLNKRKREHFNAMVRGLHPNYKVQKAYDSYSYPEFIILEEVNKVDDLPTKEIQWCNEFEALGGCGLCIIEPGSVASGVFAGNSKYTKSSILRVFSLLYSTYLLYREIEEKSGVLSGNIKSIKLGKCHLWLKDEYPDKYSAMLLRSVKGTSNLNKKYPPLKKDGVTYYITNIAEFCREIFGTSDTHQQAISKVLRGKLKSHKGFVLAV